jgi:SAM-dependent methyltransferase
MGMTDEHREALSQREIWNDLVGDAWVKHAAIHDEQAAPFGRAVMDALGDLTGARVLDVGCGTGATTAELVEGGATDVLGVDLSTPMIDAARAVACENVRFEVGDVVELDAPGTFDVVFSRFGVMFFDDPIAAFSRLRALGTDKARLGFCCWGPPADNPVMTLPVMASVAMLGPPHLTGPGEPGPFSLSSKAIIHDVLATARWAEIEVRVLTLDHPHPAGDAEAVADMALEFNPLLLQGVRRQPAKRAPARAAIIQALSPFERDGVVHLPANGLIVTATADPSD